MNPPQGALLQAQEKHNTYPEPYILIRMDLMKETWVRVDRLYTEVFQAYQDSKRGNKFTPHPNAS